MKRSILQLPRAGSRLLLPMAIFGCQSMRYAICLGVSWRKWLVIQFTIKNRGTPSKESMPSDVIIIVAVIMEMYGLEMIIALSFRIKSRNTEIFRRWLMIQAMLLDHKMQFFIFTSCGNDTINGNEVTRKRAGQTVCSF